MNYEKKEQFTATTGSLELAVTSLGVMTLMNKPCKQPIASGRTLSMCLFKRELTVLRRRKNRSIDRVQDKISDVCSETRYER
jgi:hypothetical protein